MKTNRYYIAALLMALSFVLYSGKAHAQTPEVTSIKTTTVRTHVIRFGDGTVITLVGSKAKKRIDSAYKAVAGDPTIITVGKGSGSLDLGTLTNSTIKVKPGNYTNININKATNSKIDLTGVKMPGGWIDLRDINGLEISGGSISNITGRAIAVRGYCSGLKIKNFVFKSIGDIAVAFENRDKYNGTEATLNRNSEVSSCKFEDVPAGVSIGAGFDDKGNPQGFSTGFKFLHNELVNCPSIGNWLSVNVGDDVTADYNTVDHVNYKFSSKEGIQNGTHNRLIMIVGNGRARYNKSTNYQGNFIAFWGLTPGSKMKDVEIANNIAYGTWKYSAFELQVPPYFLQIAYDNPGKISYTNAEVHHNAAGDLNRSLDWEGQMLDLYNTYGAVKYHHNLGFRMNRVTGYTNDTPPKPITTYSKITDMINYNGSGTSMEIRDNKYFDTEALATAFQLTDKSYGVQ